MPGTVRLPSELTDMQAGRMLIQAGRLEHARAFLEQAQPTDDDEWVERLFLLGQIEMQPRHVAGAPPSGSRRSSRGDPS